MSTNVSNNTHIKTRVSSHDLKKDRLFQKTFQTWAETTLCLENPNIHMLEDVWINNAENSTWYYFKYIEHFEYHGEYFRTLRDTSLEYNICYCSKTNKFFVTNHHEDHYNVHNVTIYTIGTILLVIMMLIIIITYMMFYII
jgi:hypothetical protein